LKPKLEGKNPQVIIEKKKALLTTRIPVKKGKRKDLRLIFSSRGKSKN